MTNTESSQRIDFDKLVIEFDERVLRPRPWTVEQSQWAAEILDWHAPDGPVLELCSGAGQIGLLTAALTARPLVCVDVNPVACEFARRNAAVAGLESLVEVREGRIDEAVRPEERFALVLADPPWVPRDQVGRYPEDPTLAIDGGSDGLELARTCLRTAVTHVLPGGTVLLQLGTRRQATALTADVEEYADAHLTQVRECEGGVLVRIDRDPDAVRP